MNLADPGLEPMDEQLKQLLREAFAGVRGARDLALMRLKAEIEREREKVLRTLRSDHT